MTGGLAVIGNNLPVTDLNYPFGVGCNVLIMSDQHDGVSLPVKLPQDLHDLFAALTVQRTGRFIRQNHITTIHQRPGNTDALLLAAGKLTRPVTLFIRQPQTLQQ